MQHQLDFWPVAEKAPHNQEQWQSLCNKEQAERIALLARLIARAICPQLIDATQENSHEQ